MAKTLKEHNFFGFDATIVADSINANLLSEGIICRGTTMVVTFPRIVLAEFNTHRMFSRNSASSRAIPFKKMIERVEKYPFIPIAWQSEHTGMQGSNYITDPTLLARCKQVWIDARDNAIDSATMLDGKDDHLLPQHESLRLNVTKQIANRLLEPFLWHTVIVSATEWENFFELRCPQYQAGTGGKAYRSRKDLIAAQTDQFDIDILDSYSIIEWMRINKSHADIHIQLVAEAMWDAYNESIPKQLKGGEWHIPFGDEINEGKLWQIVNSWEQHRELEPAEVYFGTNQKGFDEAKLKIAVATCARISFGNISPTESDYKKDIEMYEKLKTNRHASPFEHVFQAMTIDEYESHYRGDGSNEYHVGRKENKGWSHNLHGFISERTKLGI